MSFRDPVGSGSAFLLMNGIESWINDPIFADSCGLFTSFLYPRKPAAAVATVKAPFILGPVLSSLNLESLEAKGLLSITHHR